MKYKYLFKYTFIGDAGVGKSTLIARYVDKVYSNMYNATIGVDLKSKIININNIDIKLHFYDTAGQDRFNAITNNYIRGVTAVFITFDLGNKTSLTKARNWIKVIKEKFDIPFIFLVGAKSDIQKHIISYEDGLDIHEDFELNGYYEVSAKNNTKIDDMFYRCTNKIVSRLNNYETIPLSMNIKISGNDIDVDKKKSSCCSLM